RLLDEASRVTQVGFFRQFQKNAPTGLYYTPSGPYNQGVVGNLLFDNPARCTRPPGPLPGVTHPAGAKTADPTGDRWGAEREERQAALNESGPRGATNTRGPSHPCMHRSDHVQRYRHARPPSTPEARALRPAGDHRRQGRAGDPAEVPPVRE